MDILDLPSISDDDELDYELGDTAEIPQSGSKEQKKSANKEIGAQRNDEGQQQKDREGKDQASSATTKTSSPITSLSEQKASRKRKLANSDITTSDEDSCQISDEDEEEREMSINFAGRLAGRVKRIINKERPQQSEARREEGGNDVIALEEADEEENFAAVRFAQLLEGKVENRRNLKDRELEDLYTSLGTDTDDPQVRLNAILITGTAIEKMTTFDVTRIFAEFNPQTVRPLDRSTFIVTFPNALITAELLLEMTKPLRRIRTPKKPEEGELMESSDEDEEGQVIEEGGEDVAIIRDDVNLDRKHGRPKLLRSGSDVVELDVESYKIPPGKWRVVYQHVPENNLFYVRFANGFEVRSSVYRERQHGFGMENDFVYKGTKIRPGLNIFDEKGNELEWDYEHDTRFFEDPQLQIAAPPSEETVEAGTSKEKQAANEAEIAAGGLKIRSRGRGTKKFIQALQDSEDEA